MAHIVCFSLLFNVFAAMLTKMLIEMNWLSQHNHPDPPNEIDIASPLPDVNAAQVLFSYPFDFWFEQLCAWKD